MRVHRLRDWAPVILFPLLLASCASVQHALLYHPSSRSLPSPEVAGVAEMEVVRLITADGLALTSWYAPAGAPDRPTLVFFQGNAGNIAGRAVRVQPFLDRGLGVLLLSYRGYGGNPGVPSEAGLIADGRAALDFLAARKVPPEEIVLLGESLGAAVAVALASERTLGAVILEAPFTSAEAAGRHHFPLLPVGLFVEERYESLSRIDQIDAPLLIIHGVRDEIVPVEQGYRLLAAAKPPKEGVFLPDAGHNDLFRHGASEVAIAFLERHFGQ